LVNVGSCAGQTRALLIDQIVGAGERRGWHCKAERLSELIGRVGVFTMP
jgi:hypothetical protein